jgi:hypothetical protein
LPLLTVTVDGKKIAKITGTASGSVGGGSTGTISVTLGMDVLSKKLDVLGVTQVTISAGYLVSFNATTDKVNVTVYNPGSAAVTVTATVEVVVLGV